MEQPDQKIKVQIKPVPFSEPLPSGYSEMFFNKTDEEIEEIIRVAGDKNGSDNLLLVSEICQYISKNLSSNSISLVSNGSNIIIELSVVKTGIDSLHGPRLIADTVLYKGISNNRIIFQGEFRQNNKGWFSLTSIKTPEEISSILSKKIIKEIRQLKLPTLAGR